MSSDFIKKLEDQSDVVLRKTKDYLPFLSRLCLVATFLEDGVRMWYQWKEQSNYINHHWNCGAFIANSFVIYNLLGQIIPSGLVLARKYVKICVGVLFGVVLTQTVGYGILFDVRFLLRNVALMGGLVLLLAEDMGEAKTMFAGVPTMGENKPQNYMQLAGRVLICLMFLTLLGEMSFDNFFTEIVRAVEIIVGLPLMICVCIGYKTKLASCVLVVWLFIINLYLNPFWMYNKSRAMHDFVKYDFFQTLSVIGGLLYVITLGPGGVSFDEHKKNW
ncbi:surfeit locus protein 4-like [Bolinopsis microptera]|uniref:surfeit locus protein 4-like n=1 Tax=Bolinopsis microptera TaxID=2820187 RepID=UPI003078A803